MNSKLGPPIQGGFCIGAEKNDRRFELRQNQSFTYISPPESEKWERLRSDPEKMEKFESLLTDIERRSREVLLMEKWFHLLLKGGFVERSTLAEINRVRRERETK